NQVLQVFDRGFAGKPWLTLLCQGQDRFVMRWPKGYHLIDAKGRLKKTYQHSIGKKAMSSRKYWDKKNKEWKRNRILYMPVRHPKLPDVLLYLVISRPLKKGRQPWYLLTNEVVDSKTKAWKVVGAYQKRWQIEMTFRPKRSFGFPERVVVE
ncbi:MAG: transposase, partial [Cyanobacteria bacterium P01_A01_bin.45]